MPNATADLCPDAGTLPLQWLQRFQFPVGNIMHKLWNHFHRAGRWFPHELGDVCHLYHRCALGAANPRKLPYRRLEIGDQLTITGSLILPLLQAEGRKSPRPILRQTSQNLPDISKGHSQLGMCEFDPSRPSQHQHPEFSTEMALFSGKL